VSATDPRSFGAVVRDIGGNVDRIVRAELRVAIAEVRANLRAAGGALMLLAGAAICASMALLFLLQGLQLALARVMPPWLASLAVAVLVGVVAVSLLLIARARAPQALVAPGPALASLPEPVA
jgi:hypothetical protein